MLVCCGPLLSPHTPDLLCLSSSRIVAFSASATATLASCVVGSRPWIESMPRPWLQLAASAPWPWIAVVGVDRGQQRLGHTGLSGTSHGCTRTSTYVATYPRRQTCIRAALLRTLIVPALVCSNRRLWLAARRIMISRRWPVSISAQFIIRRAVTVPQVLTFC